MFDNKGPNDHPYFRSKFLFLKRWFVINLVRTRYTYPDLLSNCHFNGELIVRFVDCAISIGSWIGNRNRLVYKCEDNPCVCVTSQNYIQTLVFVCMEVFWFRRIEPKTRFNGKCDTQSQYLDRTIKQAYKYDRTNEPEQVICGADSTRHYCYVRIINETTRHQKGKCCCVKTYVSTFLFISYQDLCPYTNFKFRYKYGFSLRTDSPTLHVSVLPKMSYDF